VIELFVTGTDTGVGKTTVACALLAAARGRGMTALAMKPVETGCVAAAGVPGGRLPADAVALARAAHGDDARGDGVPSTTVFRFAAPLAPAVAAEREGGAVALAPILRAADRLRSLAPDLLLVEGAGGLLVPLTDALDMADLAAALAAPLLVVARDGLGTINHTLLTVEAAAARRLRVAGVVLNAVADGTAARDASRNADEIERRGRVPVLGRLPPVAGGATADLARAAERHLDLARLFGAPRR
jgi:dethiobiotin synthetase